MRFNDRAKIAGRTQRALHGGTSLLYGPHLTRFDIRAVKKTRINERANTIRAGG